MLQGEEVLVNGPGQEVRVPKSGAAYNLALVAGSDLQTNISISNLYILFKKNWKRYIDNHLHLATQWNIAVVSLQIWNVFCESQLSSLIKFLTSVQDIQYNNLEIIRHDTKLSGAAFHLMCKIQARSSVVIWAWKN